MGKMRGSTASALVREVDARTFCERERLERGSSCADPSSIWVGKFEELGVRRSEDLPPLQWGDEPDYPKGQK